MLSIEGKTVWDMLVSGVIFTSESVQQEFVQHQAPCGSPREQLWPPEGSSGFLCHFLGLPFGCLGKFF